MISCRPKLGTNRIAGVVCGIAGFVKVIPKKDTLRRLSSWFVEFQFFTHHSLTHSRTHSLTAKLTDLPVIQVVIVDQCEGSEMSEEHISIIGCGFR